MTAHPPLTIQSQAIMLGLLVEGEESTKKDEAGHGNENELGPLRSLASYVTLGHIPDFQLPHS
jgi:hypothetical protein